MNNKVIIICTACGVGVRSGSALRESLSVLCPFTVPFSSYYPCGLQRTPVGVPFFYMNYRVRLQILVSPEREFARMKNESRHALSTSSLDAKDNARKTKAIRPTVGYIYIYIYN